MPQTLARAFDNLNSNRIQNLHGETSPSLEAVRPLVSQIRGWTHSLNDAARLPEESSVLLSLLVISGSSEAILFQRRGWNQWIPGIVLANWSNQARAFGVEPPNFREAKPPPSLTEGVDQTDAEWVSLFQLAAFEDATSERGTRTARSGLRSLKALLDLSNDDVGRMMTVNGETIRRWERGDTSPPTERMAQIATAAGALQRLLEYFAPGKLPQVIRREADIFDGRRALDWILEGRIQEVEQRYESALTYQG